LPLPQQPAVEKKHDETDRERASAADHHDLIGQLQRDAVPLRIRALRRAAPRGTRPPWRPSRQGWRPTTPRRPGTASRPSSSSAGGGGATAAAWSCLQLYAGAVPALRWAARAVAAGRYRGAREVLQAAQYVAAGCEGIAGDAAAALPRENDGFADMAFVAHAVVASMSTD